MAHQQPSKLISSFVANIIDIYDKDCIAFFVRDGKLNIDTLLKHKLTKITLAYQAVWNHLFDTWATKKDVMSFYNDVLNITSNYHNLRIQLDVNLLNVIITHEPFVLARMGVLHKTNSLREVFNVVIAKLNDVSQVSFMCDSLQQRWKHRFNVCDVEMMSLSTILKTFIKYHLENRDSRTSDNKKWSHVTGFHTECHGCNSWELEELNKNEVIQYHIHRDNRFLLQLATQAVIVVDDETVSNLNLLISSIHKHIKRNVVIINLNSNTHICEKARFTYHISKDIYCLLPKISTKLWLLSNRHKLTDLQLCCIPMESFVISNNKQLSREQTSHFAFVMTTDIKKVDPSQSWYFLPMLDGLTKHSHTFNELAFAAMTDYFTQKCPFRTNNPRNNSLLFANFTLIYLTKCFEHMVTTLHNYKGDDSARQHVHIVSVDNRYNPLTLMSVLASFYNIIKHKSNTTSVNGTVGYKATIYSNKKNSKKYNDIINLLELGDIIHVEHWTSLDKIDVFTMEDYNNVLKDARFWKSIHGDTCVIVQDDGFVVNGSDFVKYLSYDYVGAPWVDTKDNEYIKHHINPEMVGNGGFSLRNIAKMIEVCETFEAGKKELFYHNINEVPEDVYFVKHLRLMNANIAPYEVAKKFSVEQVMHSNPIGFHKFWLYHVPSMVNKMFDSFLR